MKAVYRVIQNYSEKEHGRLEHPKRIIKCVKSFKKGDVFEPKTFVTEHMNDLGKNGKLSKRGNQWTVTEAIKVGRTIGLLERMKSEPISFEDFAKLETVAYFASQP